MEVKTRRLPVDLYKVADDAIRVWSKDEFGQLIRKKEDPALFSTLLLMLAGAGDQNRGFDMVTCQFEDGVLTNIVPPMSVLEPAV